VTNQKTIRVGIIGAGGNSRARHIPGFRALPNVEVVAVANRSRASSEKAARELNIPRAFDTYQDLLEDPLVDAVCIGTWPYMHFPITVAALEAGKHVLTEARMAMDAAEAREMLDASRRRPELVAQVVPSPFTFEVDRMVMDLIAEGYLGDMVSIELRTSTGTFPDFGGPLTWRQDRELSGYNILTMGIWYEALLRWLGPATKVMAMTKVVVPQRKGPDGRLQAVTIPDHVDVLCEMACGAQAHLAVSAVSGLNRVNDIWLFGTEGTLYVDGNTWKLYGGKRGGERTVQEIIIPEEKKGKWRVEEEFINAIRGTEQVTTTTFEDGVKYMEFTEAVTRSAQTGQAVPLPL
jgi:predicted dehydrogenase